MRQDQRPKVLVCGNTKHFLFKSCKYFFILKTQLRLPVLNNLQIPVVFFILALSVTISQAQRKEPDWTKLKIETMEHFKKIIQINSSFPSGSEAPVVEYLRSVLTNEGISTQVFALDVKRPNLVARLKGNGKKRPILLMAHTDVVSVDSTKWTHPPFSATREGGYVYGRGTIDDKDNVVSALMVMLLLKRLNVKLDRDVIFLAESDEEGDSRMGIEYMINEHWSEIDAEFCFAEGGHVFRTHGKIKYSGIATTEKIVRGVKLMAHGPSGHGSVPLRGNAIVHLSQAIAKISSWDAPIRLNETTRNFLERLATVSSAEEAARYQAILTGNNADKAQEYFAAAEPRTYSMLRTSVSPNIIKGGYGFNIIPSEAEATLDIRALPDEDMGKFLDEMKQVINDPQVEIISAPSTRPWFMPSKLDSEGFLAAENASKKIYNTITIPMILTGGTDMAYLRAKGMHCYGIGPMIDTGDGAKGFSAHGDQERILEESLHNFVQFNWEIIFSLAASKQ
jgi:acetylornithine deacetylase/succinyl-diaminopimelate desuccinylase-like protein